MGTHEGTELGAVVVRAHEQLALVLVTAGIAGRRLRRRCQALEVELVGVPLAVNFRHYVLVVVVPGTEQAKWKLSKDVCSLYICVHECMTALVKRALRKNRNLFIIHWRPNF